MLRHIYVFVNINHRFYRFRHFIGKIAAPLLFALPHVYHILGNRRPRACRKEDDGPLRLPTLLWDQQCLL